MKNRFYFLPILVTLVSASAGAAQLNTKSTLIDTVPETAIEGRMHFTKVIEDLPLMPGLEPVETEDVLFEEPVMGRIAQTSAIGSIDIDELYKFYASALPSLGWKRVDAKNYVRGNDRLRIEAHAEGKVTSVKFSVRPVETK